MTLSLDPFDRTGKGLGENLANCVLSGMLPYIIREHKNVFSALKLESSSPVQTRYGSPLLCEQTPLNYHIYLKIT